MNRNVIKPSIQQSDYPIYRFFSYTEPTELFFYVCIGVGVFFLFQFLSFQMTHIVAIIVSSILIMYRHQQKSKEDETSLKDIYNKMEMIRPNPTYFYLDSDIIQLVDNIKEYREYNIISFSRMIYAIDTLLELVNDVEIGVELLGDHIEVAKHQKEIATESLRSILFKLPQIRTLEYKLERSVYLLQLYLQRHIDKMIHKNDRHIQEHGYNSKTKIIQIDEPAPHAIPAPNGCII